MSDRDGDRREDRTGERTRADGPAAATGRTFSIGELVQASGVPRRTVHYYVQRGLLPPPEGGGRGHFYRPHHLERLMRIRELQDRGVTLEEIRLASEPMVATGRRASDRALPPLPSSRLGLDTPLPPIELVTRIVLGEGIELVISHGARPPSPGQVRTLAAAAASILRR